MYIEFLFIYKIAANEFHVISYKLPMSLNYQIYIVDSSYLCTQIY